MNASTTYPNAGDAAAPAKPNDDSLKNGGSDKKDMDPTATGMGGAGASGSGGSTTGGSGGSGNGSSTSGSGNASTAPAKDDDGDAGAQVKALRDHVDATWQTARDVVADKTKVAGAKAKEVADTAHAYAREEPWQVAGAALAVGVLIGLLLGRR